MHRLAEAGIRVPIDFSIVGYDDIPAARLVTPSLTTIAPPTRAQGVVAVHHLLSIIKGARPRLDEPTTLPVQLIPRESSGRSMTSRQSAGLNRVGDGSDARQQMATDCFFHRGATSMVRMTASGDLQLHPARLLPADPGVRAIAVRLYETVRDQPIVSPHGHVDPRSCCRTNRSPIRRACWCSLTTTSPGCCMPAACRWTPWASVKARSRKRSPARPGGCCAATGRFSGAPRCGTGSTANWARSSGSTERPSAANADAIYDQINAQLAEPEFRPRALLEKFNIEMLATTDDPADDLAAHAALTADRRCGPG